MKLNTTILDSLFAFPIIMVDGDNEERKHRNRSKMKDRFGDFIGDEEPEEEGVDIIIGEAECPYYDFISATDRWLPTDESVRKAISGKFEACYVTFSSAGSFVCPWTKDKFKTKLREFIENQSTTFNIAND